MSLIPFILDLADELNEFSRCFVSGVDVDDFGFGMYPHELQPASPRRPRSMSQLLYLPNSRGRSHPYWRSGSRSGCSKASSSSSAEKEKEAAAGISLSEKPNEGASKAATAAYSVVNKNGFQVSMNVKQFSPNELTVKTIDSCIVVEGQHDEKEDGHGVISRHFVRKYMLPKGFDPNDVLSTLSSDGILTVKAPPPPTKAEEKLERCVHIQQTGPAQLLAKDGGGGGAANKEKLQIVSTAAAATTTQAAAAAAIQPQKQPAAEEEKSTVVIERNGDANVNANANAVEINAKRETATEPASAATSIEPMLLVANIVTPSAIDAILTASAAAVATAMEENESDNGTVADIPMTDVTVPAGVIESIVLVSADEGAIAGSAGGAAVAIVGDDIAIPTPPTAGDLVAAADAAILMAKAQCGENGNKIAAEELAN